MNSVLEVTRCYIGSVLVCLVLKYVDSKKASLDNDWTMDHGNKRMAAGLFGSDSIVFISIMFFENDTILLKYLYFCI
jgi:hypothetical protein